MLRLSEDCPMNRLHTTAAALLIFALAGSGCARNRTVPGQLAPSQVTTIAVNSYMWKAAIDTVSFAPLIQANPASGVIITDWYSNPKVPQERVKLTVAVLDRDLRSDALRVTAAKQVYQDGGWVEAPVSAATVQKLEDIIMTRARDLRRLSVRG